MNIDMELYKIFYIVATNRNISKAAESLFISQPAISKSIKKLETSLDCELFIRNSRGVTLSKEGEVLYNYIERAMKEITNGENIINKLLNKEIGHIRIGVSNTLCKYLLIPFLHSFCSEYSSIKLQVINKTTNDTLELLEAGRIDFGIVSLPLSCDHYDFIKIMDVNDIFVVKRGVLDYVKDSITPDQLVSHPIMLLEPNNITRQYLDKYFLSHGITAQPEIEIGHMEFLIEFAKLGLGISAVVKKFVLDELDNGELREIHITPSIPSRPIGIVTHKKIPISLASKTFIDYIKKGYS